MQLAPLAATVIFSIAFSACQKSAPQAFVAHGPLPPPPSGSLKFAGTPPEHPFHKEGELFTRTIFSTDGPGNSRIEVRDFLIPPHGKGPIAGLPGPAVMDVASGSVNVSSGDKPELMASGAMRALAAGATVQVENPDAQPTVLRLYVIHAR